MKKKSKAADRTRYDLRVAHVGSNSDQPLTESRKGRVAINSSGRTDDDTRSSVARSGDASYNRDETHIHSAGKPRKNKRGQFYAEPRVVSASSDPASSCVESTIQVRDHNSERVQRLVDAQADGDSLRPAIESVEPINTLQDDSFVGHHSPDSQTDGANDAGQRDFDSQSLGASDNLSDNQHFDVTRGVIVVAEDGHTSSDSHDDPAILKIQELWKNRQAWHRAEKSLTLQGKAQCRRFTEGDKDKANKLFASLEKVVDGSQKGLDSRTTIAATAISPFIEARTPLAAHRKLIEKELIKLAKSLPIYAWAEPIKGLGPLSVAAIVGCTSTIDGKTGRLRTLDDYDTVSRLWKRMGLAVINGKRQRRVKDAIEALEHGFAPERAAVMYNISGGLIGGMGHGPRPKVGEDISLRDDLSPYQKRFIELIRKEVERVTDTWNGPEHKRKPVEKNGELYESYSSHAANRIRRRIAKEFLCDMLVAWKALTSIPVKPTGNLSAPTFLEAAE